MNQSAKYAKAREIARKGQRNGKCREQICEEVRAACKVSAHVASWYVTVAILSE